MAQKTRVPNPPKRSQGPQRRSTSADPGAAEQKRRMLYLVAGSGGRGTRRSPRDRLPHGRRRQRRRARRARGRRLHAPELPGPAEQVRPLGRADAPDQAEVELVTADERASLRRAGGLGLLRRGGAARADGAQPRARRRRHPLRAAVPEGRGREDPRVVRRGPERSGRRAAHDEQEQGHALARGPRPTPPPAPETGAAAGSRPARSSTRPRSTPSSQAHRYKGPERLLPEQLAPGN